jgi:hypothetical protein
MEAYGSQGHMLGNEQGNLVKQSNPDGGRQYSHPHQGPGCWLSLLSLLTLTGVISPNLQAQTPSPPAMGRLNANRCDFSRPVPLQTSNRYDMLGDDSFETLVCGYLVTKQEDIFGERITTAYLRILRFQDPGFQRALAQQVAAGNSVNEIKNGVYDFNLGCFQNRQIVGMNHDPKRPYLMPAVQNQLLSSTATNPVAVILAFGKRTGGGCECCNTAHTIRLY